MSDERRLARSIANGHIFGSEVDLILAARVLERSHDEWEKYLAKALRERAEAAGVEEFTADERLARFDLYERVAPEGIPVVYVMAGAVLTLAGLLIWWF